MATDTSAAPSPPTPPPPPPFGADHGGLRRSTSDRYLGGVAGGVAEHLGIEANVVRVAVAVAAVFSFGFVVVAYAAAWLLLADATDDEPLAVRWYREHGPRSDRPLASVILIVLGVLVASSAWGIATNDVDGPVRLLVLGAVIAFLATRHQRSGPSDPGCGHRDHRPPPPAPGWTPGPVPMGDDDTVVSDPVPTAIEPWPGTPPTADDEPPSPAQLAAPLPHWFEDPDAPAMTEATADPESTRALLGRRSPTAVARRRRHRLVRNFFLLGAVEGAAVTGALWASGWVRVPGWVVPATVLAVVLVGLASAPLWGWSWSLSGLAVLTLPFLLLAAVPGVTLRGGLGYRHVRPTAVADLPGTYRVGAGHQDVDLTALCLADGSRTVVHVETGLGATDVRVPASADLELRGHLGGGSVFVDGEPAGIDGTDVHFRRRYPALSSPAGRSRATADRRTRPTIVIDADLGLGALSIDRAA